MVPSQRSQPCGRWFLQWFPPPCRRPSRQPGVFENRYHCNQLIRGDALRCPAFSRTVFGRPFLRSLCGRWTESKHDTANMSLSDVKHNPEKSSFITRVLTDLQTGVNGKPPRMMMAERLETLPGPILCQPGELLLNVSQQGLMCLTRCISNHVSAKISNAKRTASSYHR